MPGLLKLSLMTKINNILKSLQIQWFLLDCSKSKRVIMKIKWIYLIVYLKIVYFFESYFWISN